MTKATEAMRQHNRRHGHAPVGAISAEYRAWSGMKRRCLNPNDIGYARYGGKGITVSAAWIADFRTFLADMGPKPSPQHSIDRIDNNGSYTGPSARYPAGNCRWATVAQQDRNRTYHKRIVVDGVGRLACEWADISGIRLGLIAQRIRLGWSPKAAVYTAPRSQQTHCKRGHPLEGENLRITSTGSRQCLECKRRNDAAYRAQRTG